jgi:hypothetical protein
MPIATVNLEKRQTLSRSQNGPGLAEAKDEGYGSSSGHSILIVSVL